MENTKTCPKCNLIIVVTKIVDGNDTYFKAQCCNKAGYGPSELEAANNLINYYEGYEPE